MPKRICEVCPTFFACVWLFLFLFILLLSYLYFCFFLIYFTLIKLLKRREKFVIIYIYIIWAFVFPKDIFYKYIDIFVHDIPGVEIFFSGVRHFFRNCSVLFLKIFHLTTTYVDAKSWFLSDHQHTFRDFEANVKLHFFVVWSKNKYNSNLCTWNYSEHFHNCKNFGILWTLFSYFELKQWNKGKIITEKQYFPGRITGRAIFDGLDKSKASICLQTKWKKMIFFVFVFWVCYAVMEIWNHFFNEDQEQVFSGEM